MHYVAALKVKNLRIERFFICSRKSSIVFLCAAKVLGDGDTMNKNSKIVGLLKLCRRYNVHGELMFGFFFLNEIDIMIPCVCMCLQVFGLFLGAGSLLHCGRR